MILPVIYGLLVLGLFISISYWAGKESIRDKMQGKINELEMEVGILKLDLAECNRLLEEDN